MAVPFDTATPNMARMYDYWLGGKDNFEADRQAAEAVRAVRPNVSEQALDNKKFLTRAVRYVAERGVRQFIDVGAGLPTSPSAADGTTPAWLATHEAAVVTADPVVAYVDNDPVAVLHSQALLTGSRAGIVAVEADMRDPASILTHPGIRGAGFEPSVPPCVILACVLHFVDARAARDIVTAFTRALAPGSYLIASVGFSRDTAFASTYNAQQGPRIYAHSWDEITGFFAGLELIPPGLTDTASWPLTPPAVKSSMIAGGIARRN
jgi:O-methyltransferase involved in polyketide biosynthesis